MRVTRQTRRRLERETIKTEHGIAILTEKGKTEAFNPVDRNHYIFLVNKKRRLQAEAHRILSHIKEDEKKKKEEEADDTTTEEKGA